MIYCIDSLGSQTPDESYHNFSWVSSLRIADDSHVSLSLSLSLSLSAWVWVCVHAHMHLGGSVGKESASNAAVPGSISGLKDFLEEKIVTHSSILAWEIPWTVEPDRLYSPWSHTESDMTEQLMLTFTFICVYTYMYILGGVLLWNTMTNILWNHFIE